MHRITLISVLLLLLVSCAKEENPTSIEPVSVSGVAADALIIDGLIKVYKTNSSKVLATTRTEEDGSFDLPNLKLSSGYYRFEVSGGHYFEESSGDKIMLESHHKLDALSYVEPGTSLTITISPLSSVHYDYSRCLIKDGKLENNADREAATQLASMYEFNVTSITPHNITHESTSTSFSSDKKYGFIQAGRSQQTLEINKLNNITGHGGYSSIDLAMTARIDLQSDCLLDGKADSEYLYLGDYQLTTNTYRSELAASIIDASKSDYNKTNFGPEDVLGLANTISTNTEKIFGVGSTQEFDLDGPTISIAAKTGDRLVGETHIGLTLRDRTDIGLIEFYIDNVLQSDYFGETELDLEFDTAFLEDGTHEFKVVAYDIIGNQSVKTISLDTSNTAIPFTIVSPTQTNTPTYSLDIEFDDTAEYIQKLLVDGVSATKYYDHWRTVVSLSPGLNVLNLSITSTEREIDEAITVCYDNSSPSITLEGSTALLRDKYSDYEFIGDLDSSDIMNSLVVNPETYSIGNNSATESELTNAGLPYIRAYVTDSVYGCEDNVQTDYRFKRNGEWLSDWDIVNETSTFNLPLVSEWIGAELIRSRDNDKLDLYVRSYDMAGNETIESFKTTIVLDFDKLNVSTFNTDLNQLSAYNYDYGKGSFVSDCNVSAGSCNINIVNAESQLMLEALSVRYIEPFGNMVIYTENDIQGIYSSPIGQSNVLFNPFSNIYNAFLQFNLKFESDFALASTNAVAAFKAKYGFNPVSSDFSDTEEGAEYWNSFIRLAHRSLSETAHIIYGGFSESNNSISLSEIVSSDLVDGIEDGTYYGQQLSLQEENYKHTEFNKTFAETMLDIAYEEVPYLIDDVIAVAQSLYTPSQPTLNVLMDTGVLSGVININANVTSETDFTLLAYLDGDAFHAGGVDFDIDTTLISDGQHTLEIQIEDRFKQSVTKSFSFISDNQGPSLVRLSNRFESNDTHTLIFNIDDTSDIAPTMTVNGVEHEVRKGENSIEVVTDKTYSVFDLIILDANGNETSKTIPVLKVPKLVDQAWQGIVEVFSSEDIDNDTPFILETDDEFVSSHEFGDQVTVSSTAFPDGNHQFGVVLIDEEGEFHSTTQSILIDNTGPLFSLQSKNVISTWPYMIDFTVEDEYSDVAAVEINESSIDISKDNLSFGPIQREGDFNKLKITSFDSLGNSSTVQQWFALPAIPTGAQKGVKTILERLPTNTHAKASIGNEEFFAGGYQYLKIDLAHMQSGLNGLEVGFGPEGDDLVMVPVGNIMIDNDAPKIETSPAIILTSGDLDQPLSVYDEHSSLQSVIMNGGYLDIIGGTHNSNIVFDPSVDYSEMRIYAIDELDTSTSEKIAILDARTLEAMESVNGNALLFDMVSFNGAVGEVSVSVNGINLTNPAKNNPFILDTTLFMDGPTQVEASNKHIEHIDSKVVFGKQIIIDNTPPEVSLLSGLIITSDQFFTEFAIVDQYSDINSFKINGVNIGIEGPYLAGEFNRTGDFYPLTVSVSDSLMNLDSFSFNLATPQLTSEWINTDFNLLTAMPLNTTAIVNVDNTSFEGIAGGDLLINVSEISSGEHIVDLTYSDFTLGTDTESIGIVKVDHDGPVFDIDEITFIYGTTTGLDISVYDEHSGLDKFIADGKTMTLDNGVFNGDIYENDAQDYKLISIYGIDNIGNESFDKLAVLNLSGIHNTDYYSGTVSLIKEPPHYVGDSIIEIKIGEMVLHKPEPETDWTLDTTRLDEGSHYLSISLTHPNGVVKEYAKDIIVDNTAPEFIGKQIALLTQTDNSHLVSFADFVGGIDSITVNGDELDLNDDFEFTGHLDLIQESDYYEHVVVATNKAGESTLMSIAALNTSRMKMLSSVNGQVLLFDNTPQAESLSTIQVLIDGVTHNNPDYGDQWYLDTTLLTDGTHTIEVRLTDGHDVLVSNHTILVDNTAPTISIHSTDITSNSEYTLQGETLDSISDLVLLSINGEDVPVNSDGSWAHEAGLINGLTNFDLVGVDKVGNQASLNFGVKYDFAPPYFSSLTSEIRVWDNGNVRYDPSVVDESNLGTLLLYPEYRAGGSAFSDVDSLQDKMWVQFKIIDGFNGTSYRFSSNELSAQYRYLVDGTQKRSWNDLILAPDGRIKIGIDQYSLTTDLYFSNPDAVHEIELLMTDPLGNYKYQSIIFKVDIGLAKD
jgi:hypothetical protein